MKRTTVRLGALASAAALTLLSAAPAHAATVAQATANAYTLKIAESGTDSGTVVATHDGSGAEKTGSTNPPVDALDNQELLNAGVLAQDAAVRVQDNGAGWSAACAGVAGEGGSVAQVGDSGCITPGEPVGLSIANLDLTGVELTDPESALAPLGAAAQPLADELVGPLTAAVSDGLEPLGAIGIAGTLGAVEARCVAAPGRAQGTANIVNSQLTLTAGGESVDVVNLPASPEPNTEVPVELDSVADTVLDALRTDLETTLDGALSDLGGTVVAPVQEEIVDNVIGQIAPQLQPLQDNVLRIVLNEQSGGEDSVEVTALHAEVLPAAAQLGGPSLLDAKLGTVTCGPNGEMAPAAPQQPGDVEQALPAVPTAVASGVDGSGDGVGYGAVALGALVALAGAAGVIGLRRSVTE